MKLGNLTRKYLSGADLGQPHLITIQAIGQIDVRPYPGSQPVKKVLITYTCPTLAELPNQFLLGKQGEQDLAAIFGKIDVRYVIGQRMIIYPEDVRVGGKPRVSIRLAHS